jgi:hypothetical protein
MENSELGLKAVWFLIITRVHVGFVAKVTRSPVAGSLHRNFQFIFYVIAEIEFRSEQLKLRSI